jgi:hypothetical protein
VFYIKRSPRRKRPFAFRHGVFRLELGACGIEQGNHLPD